MSSGIRMMPGIMCPAVGFRAMCQHNCDRFLDSRFHCKRLMDSRIAAAAPEATPPPLPAVEDIKIGDYIRMPPITAGLVENRAVPTSQLGLVKALATKMVLVKWPSGHETWEQAADVVKVRELPWHMTARNAT